MKFGPYVAVTLTAAAIGVGAYLSFERHGPPVPAPEIGYTRLDGTKSELGQLRGFATIAVAMSYDPPASVAHFAQTRRLPFDVAIDNTGEIAQRFGGIRGTPTTLLINKRGEIVRRYVGEPDFAALQRLVDELLAET